MLLHSQCSMRLIEIRRIDYFLPEIDPDLIFILRILQRFGFKKLMRYCPIYGQKLWIVESCPDWFARNGYNYSQLPPISANDLVTSTDMEIIHLIMDDIPLTLHQSDIPILSRHVILINSCPWVLNCALR